MISYCLVCKKRTDTLNPKQFKAKNGRNMIKGKCAVCGKNKSITVKGGVLPLVPLALVALGGLASGATSFGVQKLLKKTFGSGNGKGLRRMGDGLRPHGGAHAGIIPYPARTSTKIMP